MAKGCGIFAALGLVGLMFFCGTVGFLIQRNRAEYEASTTPEQRAADKERAEAERKEWSALRAEERLVKDLITERLKAPSTAKFSLQSGFDKNDRKNIITRGYVDSQNSFGAMIRSEIEALSTGRDLVYLRLDDKILLDRRPTTR